MKKITIAFDIDGTLRCNCTPVCQDTNQEIVSLAHILSKYFKNVQLHAWSGGGKDYTHQFIRSHGLGKIIPESRCHSKVLVSTSPYHFENTFHPDIAIDDIQDFSLGGINLIVKLK
jgi:hypothetical protein